jgi:hypothetical protein
MLSEYLAWSERPHPPPMTATADYHDVPDNTPAIAHQTIAGE